MSVVTVASIGMAALASAVIAAADAFVLPAPTSPCVPRAAAQSRKSASRLFQRRCDERKPGSPFGEPTTEARRIAAEPTDSPSATTPLDRRMFFASSLIGAGAALGSASVADAVDIGSNIEPGLRWVKDPVNKRYGVTVDDVNKAGYNDAFITYLTRFLLNFDRDVRALWFAEQPNIPLRASQEQVNRARFQQFGEFSASVAVGLLQNYSSKDGPKELLLQLKARYCPDALVNPKDLVSTAEGADASADADNKTMRRKRREAREAQRQLAIMFGLLGPEIQPTKEITKLLAGVDNASFQTATFDVRSDKPVVLNGYSADGPQPVLEVAPPQAGEGVYKQATLKAVLTPTGKLLRVNLDDGGSGYDPKSPPAVVVSPPSNSTDTLWPAVLKAKVSAKGGNKGSIESIEIVDPGSGYNDKDKIQITVEGPLLPVVETRVDDVVGEAPPIDMDKYRTATVSAVLDLQITGIQIVEPGSGYAAERPLRVFLVQPPKSRNRAEERIEVGKVYPQSDKTSYTSFRKEEDDDDIADMQEEFNKRYKVKSDKALRQTDSDGDDRIVSGVSSGKDSGLPALPFFGGRGSSSEQLLSLLPAGFGLEYDLQKKYYFLSVDQKFREKYANLNLQSSSNRPLSPDFGPRGRSPIEREMDLGLDTYLRFTLSGAICASGVNLALTPLDVVKTKVQTEPAKYKTVGSAFGVVQREEGLPTFFTGWAPTFVGNFFAGGALYALTEIIRRLLTEAAGVNALRLEVPFILVAAAVASAVGSVLICPFEAVRIRLVAQPDFAPNALAAASRMVKEEGVGSLVNAVPVFLAKNIPYAMVKFLIFDLSTEFLFHEYPVANEDLRLSLLISLIGGILGGTSAAIVSNPADAVISELKKSKSDISPQQAVTNILDRGGVNELFKGLPLRIIFFSVAASLQFSVYDGVRFALGIGSDDLKLYLDVLNGALTAKGVL